VICNEAVRRLDFLLIQFMTSKHINGDKNTKLLLKAKKVLPKMVSTSEEDDRNCDRSLLWMRYTKDGMPQTFRQRQFSRSFLR